MMNRSGRVGMRSGLTERKGKKSKIRRKQTVKKRVLASLLTLCLLVGLLPTTALAKGSGRSAGKINLSFYYAYSNTIPNPAQEGGTTAQEYGPSGNDVPLRTAEVDLDTLFSRLGDNASSARNTWENDEYITAASCGYENNADWWELVVSCMTNVDDRTYFTEGVGAELYQGYVIKKVDKSDYPYHCDGILLEKPPLYLVEIEDVTNHHYIGTLTSNSETEFTAGSVQSTVKEYLLEEYGKGTINWDDNFCDGIFTGKDASYQVKLAYSKLNNVGTIEYTEISEGYYLATVEVTLDKFFTVTYDANGGDVNSVPKDTTQYTGHVGAAVADILYNPIPTWTGHTFLGWATTPNASQPTYTLGGTDKKIQVYQNITLYAIWKRNVPTYTLTYDANGGYWGTSDTTRTETDLPAGPHTLIYSDTSATAVSPAPTHDPVNGTDILFVGWTLDDQKLAILDKDATEDDVPQLSTSINMNQSFTVYAVWAEDSNGNDVPDYQEKAITVNFDLKGGNTSDTRSFTLKPFPEKTDIKFGTAPAVTPPTGQEFINWTLQGDPTKTLGNKVGFTYDSIFKMTGGKKTTVTFEANYQSSNVITITPADITIYTGGDGYNGVVEDATGNIVEGSEKSGLPEPGYYFDLPAALDTYLKKELQTPTGEAVNLSEHIRLRDKNDSSRMWILELYDGTDSSAVNGRYIYRLTETGTGTSPAKLQISDGAEIVTSDNFSISATAGLYKTYQMNLYTGAAAQGNIVVEVEKNGTWQNVNTVVGTGTVNGLNLAKGTLTVRGADSSTPTLTTPVVTSANDVEEAITAVAPGNTTYHINDSSIATQGEIGLFTDGLLPNTVLEQYLTDNEIVESAALADGSVQVDYQYLDLVDASNGNAYVTTTNKLDIYWPVPDNADPDGDFSVVHFNGLDRNYSVSELATLIDTDGHKVEVYSLGSGLTIETIDGVKYVKFSTSTFSPFALVYETKTTPPQETVTVTFKVVNGTWSNGSSNSIKVTVTKGESLTRDQIPTGMKPNSGYKKPGSWDTTPDTNRKLNDNVTYTYTFTKSGDTEPEDEDCILYFDSNGGTEFKKIDNGNDSFRINPYSDSEYGQHIPSRPGYRFTGWYRDEDLENRISESTKINVNSIMTIYAGWERTSVPSMLNGDDHYAYIQGYADGTVRPNANITRAQVATIFFRLLDEDVRSDYLTTYNTFPDVNADYWANTAISTMASLGVINGRNSGLFDPDAYITRAEFAAICARFDDSNVSGFDSFTDTFGHWAEEEIGRAAALGWIQGYDDGTFRPNQYITRAQAVTMINRVLCRLPEDEDDLLPGMNVWTDCREGDWCYLAIQEATNSHDYVTKDRVYETWTDLNRAPDWSRYE